MPEGTPLTDEDRQEWIDTTLADLHEEQLRSPNREQWLRDNRDRIDKAITIRDAPPASPAPVQPKGLLQAHYRREG